MVHLFTTKCPPICRYEKKNLDSHNSTFGRGWGGPVHIWASRSTTRTLNSAFCTVYKLILPWTLDKTIHGRYNFYCHGMILALLSLSVGLVLDLARSKTFQFVSTYIMLGLWKKGVVFL